MVSVLRTGDRIHHIPGIGVSTSRRTVGGGNGLLNNLVAYWALDEAAGANNALDKHTNALTLTHNASPGSAAGVVYSGARTFNGTTQYFSRASEALLVTGAVDYTIAAWVYLSSKPEVASAVTKANASDGGDWEFSLAYRGGATDRYRWTIGDGAVQHLIADNYGSPATAAWTLIIGQHTVTTKTLSVSVNNGTENSANYTGTHDTNAMRFAIAAIGNTGGGIYGNYRWPGRIGPVAMWKSAAGGGGVLSSSQRTALYNSGAGLAYAAFTT